MVTLYILSILLILNITITHSKKLVEGYYWVYKKLKKPKFELGELVLINDVEFEVVLLSKNAKPYTYYCLPVVIRKCSFMEYYYHETQIKKKTGLLKELE
jgi:hypothetical protein